MINSFTNPSNDAQYVAVNLQLPKAVAQFNYNIPAMIWQGGRYLYINNINMHTGCQNEFRGTMSSTMAVSIPDANGYANDYNKKRMQMKIEFNVRHEVPKGGTVEVVWGSNVPKAYPHCRSMTNIGSVLTAEGGSENGEIGCLVQNTKNWVITGFDTLAAGSKVILEGDIDMPTSSNVYLGAGEVITYNDTHATNIRANGFIIDYNYHSTFGIQTYDEESHNVDTEITLEETLPLRAVTAYRGPLQFKFKLGSSFLGPNSSKMRVRVPKRSVYDKIGGFSYESAKKHVCKLSDILTHEEYGCIILSVTEDTTSNSENIMFEIISSSTLASSQTLQIKINTYTGVEPEGLVFPTVAGTYRITVSFDLDNSGGYEVHDHLYLEVYGTPFTLLEVESFVTL